MTTILLMPGINNSGPRHWQSLWERSDPAMRRVQVPDWDHPVCTEWVEAIGAAVNAAHEPVIIVAHSLGCLATVEWAKRNGPSCVAAAMLVAVPDPGGPRFPAEANGFHSPPLQKLPFTSVVVASTNDPYSSADFARTCSGAWGSRLVEIGEAGHINADSGLDGWEEGMALLEGLRLRLPR